MTMVSEEESTLFKTVYTKRARTKERNKGELRELNAD